MGVFMTLLGTTCIIVVGTCSTDAVPPVQGLGADYVLDYRDRDYIRNIASQGNQYGLVGGLALSAVDLIPSNLLTISQDKCVKWAYFYPSIDGLKFIDRLIRNAELVPTIDLVYRLNEIPEAFERTKAGHLRGKIVVDMLAIM
ncbi:uncharacterized protein CBL_10790 [Carabus blaptoides fortunei]